MKKCLLILVLAGIMALVVGGCSTDSIASEKEDSAISIVCTVFPSYDWIREIVGDSENFELTYLMDSGFDLHNYVMSTEDMIKIKESDILIHVGGESDEWVDKLLENGGLENVRVVNLLELLGDLAKDAPNIEGVEEHEEHEHEHEDEEHKEQEHGSEEHIWVSIKNAKKLVRELSNIVVEYDKENLNSIEQNTNVYLKELDDIDKNYYAALTNSTKNTVVFADKFPFMYLFEDYGIHYYAAFNGCSAESEASFDTIAFLSDKVNELNLNSIFILRGSDRSIAQTVIRNTSSKNQNILELDSMDTVNGEDAKEMRYTDLLQKNLEKIIEGLK